MCLGRTSIAQIGEFLRMKTTVVVDDDEEEEEEHAHAGTEHDSVRYCIGALYSKRFEVNYIMLVITLYHDTLN